MYEDDKIPNVSYYPQLLDSESEDKTGKAVKPVINIDIKDSYDVSWSDSYGSSHDPFLEMEQ